jgi:hypothetical protein
MPTLAADYTNIPHMVVAEQHAIAGTTGLTGLASMRLVW